MTTAVPTALDADTRARHEAWLRELTAIPTAAGREQRVVRWIEGWVAERDDLVLEPDEVGNLVVRRAHSGTLPAESMVFVTAHLDHPAFVVEGVRDDGLVECSFRGSVRDPYFVDAAVILHDDAGRRRRARVVSTEMAAPFRRAQLRLDEPGDPPVAGDVGTWDLPEPHVADGLLFTNACDDLAAAAAALAMLDVLRGDPAAAHVQLLFTRAEEIGFIGAIKACRLGTIPSAARVIALENSRSFPESPLRAGPIVRVGDRISTFDSELTRAVAQVAAELQVADPAFRFQRKLMAGGSCEASCFCAFGYRATCVCLPLGNYHNMADLAEVEANDPPRAGVGLEHIALSDYHDLVRLLVACGTRLGTAEPIMAMLERLETDKGWVVG